MNEVHEDDNDIAHAHRVGSADEVGEARHVEHVGTLQVHTAGFAEERLRVVKWIAMIIGSFAVVLAMTTSAYILYSRNSAADQVSHQLTAVQQQLADAQTQLAKATADASGVDICADRLSRAISAASQAGNSALIHLVVQIARQEPYDIPAAEAADRAYSAAIAQRDNWVKDGRPLPCPLAE